MRENLKKIADLITLILIKRDERERERGKRDT